MDYLGNCLLMGGLIAAGVIFIVFAIKVALDLFFMCADSDAEQYKMLCQHISSPDYLLPNWSDPPLGQPYKPLLDPTTGMPLGDSWRSINTKA
jgi:hypothetical protein